MKFNDFSISIDEDNSIEHISSAWKILSHSKEDTVTFRLDKKFFAEAALNFIRREHINSEKENYCVIWINNLHKKNEYLQLAIQLLQDQITEEEFEEELANSPDKYTIKLDMHAKKEHLPILIDLLSKTEKSYTLDEVSEMFSIQLESLRTTLDKSQYKLLF